MKYLLISLLVLIYGCSWDASTASTEPELDTTTKKSSGSWPIRRWDGEDWIDTADNLSVSWTWRFVSYFEWKLGDVVIEGVYNVQLSNPSNYDVEFVLSNVVFKDRINIPIYTIPQIKRQDVSSKGTSTVSSTFGIILSDIDSANEITEMTIWATAEVPR